MRESLLVAVVHVQAARLVQRLVAHVALLEHFVVRIGGAFAITVWMTRNFFSFK